MNYNTSRPKMIIPEYGRHIQKLIDHAISLEVKEKRNEMANAIIDVMGQLNPHLRDVEDFKHKLWDHLFIMSDFKLDVDSPYPKPNAESFLEKPNKMEYPDGKIRFKHYGKGVEDLINVATEMEEGEKKDALLLSIANLMKKHYLSWSRNSVDDKQILSDLKRISRGKIELKEDLELIDTKEISTRNPNGAVKPSNNNKNRKRKNFKPKKKY
jgi:hypothetical protein